MRVAGVLAALAALLAAPLPISRAADRTEVERPTEKEIFPGNPDGEARPSPPRLTTAYWKVSLELHAAKSPDGGWVRMALPLSDGRQALLSRRYAGEKLDLREQAGGDNLFGLWSWTPSTEASELRVELLAQISDLWMEPPTSPFPPPPADETLRPLVEPTASVPSKDPEIRRRAHEIVHSAKRLDEAAWALYQFTASFVKTDPTTERMDALSVLRDEKGTGAGKARLLTALFRSLGIPARMVGGLRLKDASKTRSTISWVEARLGDRWFPMDPSGGYFGFVPNDYLTLYRGDLPLLVHRAGLDVDYDFLVRQVTRKSSAEAEEVPRAEVLKSLEPPEVVAEQDRVQTVATYVQKPVATVVMITDERVPQAVLDRMRTEAIAGDVNLVLLVARLPSRYFRENTLRRLISSNLNVMREAHVLLVSTRDEAGLFGLLELGEHRLKLNDARILVTGNFFESVGEVLGMILYDLVDPGEMALYPRRADLLSLWEVARVNLLRGVPLLEASADWGIEPTVIDAASFDALSRYRSTIVRGWARAVRAQVPLQALTLILVLPVIAFVVVLFRSFVGMDTFGLFSPVIVSLAFLATGLYWGTVIFVVIVGLGAILRNAIQRLRLHLVARLAILVGLVSVLMTGLTVFGAYLGIGALLQVSLFPMVIMSNLIENFTASQIELGTRGAVRLTTNTLFVCMVCDVVVESTGLPSILLAFPEVLAIVVALEIVVGKYRGLRLLEYKRFYDLLRRSRSEGGTRADRAA